MMNLLLVCTANICRSPTAQIVATQLIAQRGLAKSIRVDSAGTSASKNDVQPDNRARHALLKRGYEVKKGSTRRIEAKDFERFNLILAMDHSNLNALKALCPPEHQPKLRLFLEAVQGSEADGVPDPYYGNAEGFERVLDLCEAGVEGWLSRLR